MQLLKTLIALLIFWAGAIFVLPAIVHAQEKTESVPLQKRPDAATLLSVQYGGFNRDAGQVWYSFYCGEGVTSDPLKQHELFDDTFHTIPAALGTKYTGNGGILLPVNKQDAEGNKTKEIDYWCSVANVDIKNTRLQNIVMRLDITKTNVVIHFKVDTNNDQIKLIDEPLRKLIKATGVKSENTKWQLEGKTATLPLN